MIGNYDKTEYYGQFDVYLRGVGSNPDSKGRYYVYRKLDTKAFPSKEEITDRIIALVLIYGSSVNIEAAQQQYFKTHQLPKPSDKKHDFPANLSEEGEKIKRELERLREKPVFF